MTARYVAAAALLIIIVVSRLLYDHRGRRYAAGKRAQSTCPVGFRAVYAWVQLTTIVAGFGALLSDARVFLVLHREPAWSMAGFAVALVALGLFVWSKRALGRQYSPCYDAWLPFRIVEHGPYARVRHPIYTANLLLLAGIALGTGSLWTVGNLLLVTVFYRRSALVEERALRELHPHYADYQLRTGRFLPRW